MCGTVISRNGRWRRLKIFCAPYGRFDLSILATPLNLVHYTTDLDDTSAGLTLSMQRVTYTGCLLLNHPAPQPVTPSMTPIAAKRCGTPARVMSWHLENLAKMYHSALARTLEIALRFLTSCVLLQIFFQSCKCIVWAQELMPNTAQLHDIIET